MKSAMLIRLWRVLRRHGQPMLLSILRGLATILCSVGLMSTSAYIIASAALRPSIAELQVAPFTTNFGASAFLLKEGGCSFVQSAMFIRSRIS